MPSGKIYTGPMFPIALKHSVDIVNECSTYDELMELFNHINDILHDDAFKAFYPPNG